MRIRLFASYTFMLLCVLASYELFHSYFIVILIGLIFAILSTAIFMQQYKLSEHVVVAMENVDQVTFEREQAFVALTQRKSELEAIIGSMGQGVVAIDDRNAILFVNQDFLSIYEITPQETIGRSIFEIVHNNNLTHIIEEVRIKRESVSDTFDFCGTKIKKIKITGSPLVTETNHWFGTLIIVNDMTHLNKLESIRKDFVSNVTHELKTPLTSIRGFVDTLRNGAVKDEAVAMRFLEIIDIETERLTSLINDILLLSEIESKKEYRYMPYNVIQGVEDVIMLLKDKIPKEVCLSCEFEDSLDLFMCNPNRIEQLLINLIENAIKYTEIGSVKVYIGQDDRMLVIRVSDTGIGIPDNQLDRIFERFYRVDKGRSRNQGGTGLGLSIVKHIVELYNGKIEVTSSLHKGTTFTVYLPKMDREQLE